MPGATDNPVAAAAEARPSSAGEAITCEPYTIVEQRVQLDLAFRGKQVRGTTTIKIFKTTDDDLESITLDARQCKIDTDNVTVNNQKVKAAYRDPYEFMETPKGYTWGARQHHLRMNRMKPLQPKDRNELPMTRRETRGCQPANGALRVWLRPEKIIIKTPGISGATQLPLAPNTFEITIPFRIPHVRDGLHFVGVDDGDARYPHVYTRHSIEPGFASCLFPCVDDRTRVEEWRISLKFPRTVGDALKQPLASQVGGLAPSNGNQSVVSRNPQPHRELAMTEEDKLLDMTAVCSGTLVGEHEDAADETKKVMEFQAKWCGAHHIGFAIGPFEDVDLYSAFRSEEDESKLLGSAVKVHGYCLPGRSDELCNTCQPLANATDFFTLTFSKYPYEENSFKLCFVDDMVEDTVPLQAFSLCSSRLLYPNDIIDTEIDVTRKLVHSFASQYFGIFINPDKSADTWIVVGLAYYMTDLYLRKLCGNNYYRFQIRTLAEHLTKVDHGRPSLHELGRYLHLGDFEMEFMALKAPLVIFILDRRLMKSSTSSGVTRVISARLREAMQSLGTDSFAANFVVSSDLFRRQCEKRGKLRLESFWDQWVFGSGCPRLHITQRFNKKRLEVELIVVQHQAKWAQEPHPLQKNDFWRDVIEERHNVEAAEVPLTFTGPMTFRVHEADGTPYEHCLDVKLDAAATKGSRLSMPYNTKYKRIKRVRQKKRDKDPAKAARGDANGHDEDGNDDEEYKTFGDVLLSEEDMASWKLVDWDEDQQQQMDQESYEWIRVDCDFEWIYFLETNLKVYMTVAQLQQDRDIAAQVESMLQLTRNSPSNIQTTTLLRTLYDQKYFYGIRTMAANALIRHAEPANNFRGMRHLMRIFKTLYCFPDTATPRPNDFMNKKEYYVQTAIPEALARIRGGKEFCPEEARRFILNQLVFNNNEGNAYSDCFYVAKLLEALATSLVRAQTKEGPSDRLSPEMMSFLEDALKEIDRYLKMDEWASSYQNIWTVTALDCKVKLMRSGVIPTDPLEFMQYLNEDTLDLVQIKAFEALIDLGLLLKPSIMRFIFSTVSTHQSPFVRSRVFKALTRGLAAIAFGEHDVTAQRAAESAPKPVEAAQAGQDGAEGDNSLLDEDDDGGLIVEQSDAVIKQRQFDIARREDIAHAMKALKDAVKDNQDLQREIWKAIDSPIIGIFEKRNLLELCATIFPEEDEITVTMKYPARWTVQRGPARPGKSLVMVFKQSYKTGLKRKRIDAVPEPVAEAPPAAVAAPPAPDPEQERPKKKIITLSRAGTSRIAEPSPAPSLAPVSRQPSISVVAPVRPPELERGDTISVVNRPVANRPSNMPPATSTPAPEPARPSFNAKAVKQVKKRKLADAEAPVPSPRPRKMVTLRYNKSKLTDQQRQQWARASSSTRARPRVDSIVATPVARAISSAKSPPAHGSSPLAVDTSMVSSTSTLSAGSSSQPRPSKQKTPLPNGKPARKPLPTGPSNIGSPQSPGIVARPPPPARAPSHSQQVPPASPPRLASPVVSRSSVEPGPKPKPKPKKIIKLKFPAKKKSAGGASASATSPEAPSSDQQA